MKKFLKIFSLSLLLPIAMHIGSSKASKDGSFDDCNQCTTCDFKCDPCDSFDSCDNCDDCDGKTDCRTCCNPLRTYHHFRSQGANTARELVGWQWELNKPFMCETYGAAYLAYEYQRSFRPERLAKTLFGTTTLKFSGSLAPDRKPNELLADNFGLSRNFRGSVTFCPRIENHIVDIGFYYGLDCWLQGAYFRLHAPITHTRWNLRACECVQATSPEFPPCYVGNEAVNTAPSLQCALSGKFTFGDMQTFWPSGRFDFCRRTKTGLADIDLILGYNWHNNDCSHLGAYLQLVLPTGPKPNNIYVFTPTVGNGRFFELGFGISGHHVFWQCGDHNISLFVEGNLTHMFSSRQCRLFDFCVNGPYSRYLLLKEFDNNGLLPTYNGNLVSATVFNTREVNVKVNAKGDASIKFAYRWCGWGFDLGYNIYGHTRERITLIDGCCPNDKRKFCIKGNEGTCCFDYPILVDFSGQSPFPARIFPDGTQVPTSNGFTRSGNCPPLTDSKAVVTTVPNNTCQPLSTAFENKQKINTSSAVTECTVSLSHNSKQVTNPLGSPNPGGGFNPTDLANKLVNEGFILCNQITPTKFLSVDDLDLTSGASTPVFSHKIFAHWNYTWYDPCGWNPHIGFGGEVEFSGNRASDLVCQKSGLNQWGVWLKGGFSF